MASSFKTSEEIFNTEEIILVTQEEFPRHFRIKREKYYEYYGDKKYGPYQRNIVERYRDCDGAIVEKDRNTYRGAYGEDSVIGWTTADEKIPSSRFHVVSPQTRAYHRIDLSKLEYQFQYLGSLLFNGEFITGEERPYGKDGNKVILKLRIINEEWDSYFKNSVYPNVC
ncbi:hypothetical protein OAZ19_00905 [bacterium]|nr:hypothetical protein [bacterium]